MNVFKRVWRALFPKSEIEYTRASLHRLERKREELWNQWYGSGGCCPHCMFPIVYTELCDKIERVELRVKQLQNIEKRNCRR